MSIYLIVISAILSFVLLSEVFPKIIYILSETMLMFIKVIDYSERKKDDWSNLLITRLFYLGLFLISWIITIVLYVPMQILMFIEVFGGFVGEEILCEED